MKIPKRRLIIAGAVVTVLADGAYTGIDITEPANIAGSLSDLGKEVVARQSLAIDGLNGATATKVVYLSAIANAVYQP
jgi:hypothetical protein